MAGTTPNTFDNHQQSTFQLEPTAPSFKPVSPQLKFSSGYGLRDPLQPRDPGPLPPLEERIGPDGVRHRIYPAPSPIAPPINMHEGWPSPDVPPNHPTAMTGEESPTKSLNEQVTALQPDNGGSGGWDAPFDNNDNRSGSNSEVVQRDTAPHLTKGPAAYVQWESGVDTNKVAESNKELEEQFARYRQESGGRADMFGMRQGPADGGYGNRGPSAGVGFGSGQQDSGWGSRGPFAAGGFGSGQQDSGWGNRGGGGFGGGNEWGDNAGGGYSRGGGGGDTCHNCGQEGHFSRECPTAGAGPTCYRCREQGHMSSACPKGTGRGCFNCGEDGHMSRECPTKGDMGGGGGSGGACFNCGEDGHMSRECSKGGVVCFKCHEEGHIGGGGRSCYHCGEEGHISRDCPQGTGGGDGYGNNNSGGDGWGSSNTGSGNGWAGVEATPSGDDGWGAAPSNNANSSESRGLAVHPDRLRHMDPQLRASRGSDASNGGNSGNRFGPNSEQILRHPRGPPPEPRTSWGERRADNGGQGGFNGQGNFNNSNSTGPVHAEQDNSDTGGW